MKDLKPRVFFDTDVILDFCQRREPFFEAAAWLFQAVVDNHIKGLTSAAGLKDVFNLARKGCGEKEARRIVTDLSRVFNICSVNSAMWSEALVSPQRDTEDALQVACARYHACFFLVTRNLKDYRGIVDPLVYPPEAMMMIIDSNKTN